ncbi:UDP-3-O-[3-hydroxymyristoyl] N-acetylglucosamine deacetylase [bacterium]|jgi:UDP-3-O-[3-hydroxymyristoyl] N-acetylglucosamine deacetylase / 3-hydroxyacyl-[acyl-carrier-protein] dehydratase|nr:UDP-3-O-[3-hydroxymyristoyl] N-acetylglucosamine deacetylase [bacterium]
MKQRTLASPVEFTDLGLHTGKPVTLKACPAEPNHGLVFVKKHKDDYRLKVSVDHVHGISRGTNLSDGNESIYTFEHLMAAIGALHLTNLTLEIDSDEPPILDGSGIEFYQNFVDAGIVEQDVELPQYRVVKTCEVEDNDAVLIAYPSNEFSISYTLDYSGTMIGVRHLKVNFQDIDPAEKLLRARTFCLLEEVEHQHRAGQALGGSLRNAVVVDGQKCLNEEGLRFPNEFAWHKIMDFYGDMNVFGFPILGKFVGIKSGHRTNIRLLKKMIEEECLVREVGLEDGESLDLNDIKRIIPHRYPFLLVDRIVRMEVGKGAVGIKSVTGNEEFFNGHFPDRPLMPGVLIVEALAQVAGVCLLSMMGNYGKTPFFTGLDSVRFRKPVYPGDQLELEISVLKLRGGTGKVDGVARVNGQVHVEGKLSFMIK